MTAPFVHRAQEVVDRFFIGPEVTQQFVRVARKSQALGGNQLLGRWVVPLNVFLSKSIRSILHAHSIALGGNFRALFSFQEATALVAMPVRTPDQEDRGNDSKLAHCVPPLTKASRAGSPGAIRLTGLDRR